MATSLPSMAWPWRGRRSRPLAAAMRATSRYRPTGAMVRRIVRMGCGSVSRPERSPRVSEPGWASRSRATAATIVMTGPKATAASTMRPLDQVQPVRSPASTTARVQPMTPATAMDSQPRRTPSRRLASAVMTTAAAGPTTIQARATRTGADATTTARP